QTDAELVLEQLTHGADTPVAKVVDVVGATHIAVKAKQVLDDPEEVLGRERLLVDRDVAVELDVELETSDSREVVALRVEEHPVEQGTRRLDGRRIAGAHAPEDL